MIAILAESYAGKWPFWLSPRQCIVIPVGAPFNDYAFKVYKSIIVNCYSLICNYVFLTNIKLEKTILDGSERNCDSISCWRVSPKLSFRSNFNSFWSPVKCNLHKIFLFVYYCNLLHIFVEVSHWRLSANIAPSFIFTGVIIYHVVNLSSAYPVNRFTHFVSIHYTTLLLNVGRQFRFVSMWCVWATYRLSHTANILSRDLVEIWHGRHLLICVSWFPV